METIQLILNEIIDIGGNNGIIIAGLVVSLFGPTARRTSSSWQTALA